MTAFIAAGAMGEVYEVVDERTQGRRALKVMKPGVVSDPDKRARFALEATVTGPIESDHIVRVFDAGIDETSGAPFLTMELLHGEELGALAARRGALPADEVVAYLSQAALALQKTHAAGIVHRDLKLANMFVTRRDDGSTCLKILDFGIAKIVEADARDHKTRTLGTPFYMAPEQMLGAGDIGPKADVYALAQVAYALLSGEPYWKEESLADPSLYWMLTKIMDGAKEAPSARAARRQQVQIPRAFDDWFFCCAAPAAAARYEDAGAAVAALARVLAPPQAAPPSAPALPQSAQPQSAQPQSAQPQSAQPQSAQPESAQPRATQPETVDIAVARPAVEALPFIAAAAPVRRAPRGSGAIVAASLVCAMAIAGVVVVALLRSGSKPRSEAPEDPSRGPSARTSLPAASPPSASARPPEEKVLYRDTFDDARGQWTDPVAFGGSLRVADGRLTLRAGSTAVSTRPAAAPVTPSRDFTIEIAIEGLSGPSGSYGGIGYGVTPSYDGGFVGMDASGAVRITHYDATAKRWQFLLDESKPKGFQSWNATNRLKLVVRGTKLTLHLNGERVAEVVDSALVSGALTLFAMPGVTATLEELALSLPAK